MICYGISCYVVSYKSTLSFMIILYSTIQYYKWDNNVTDLDYDVKEWYNRVIGLEFEPERGSRCTGTCTCPIVYLESYFHLISVLY